MVVVVKSEDRMNVYVSCRARANGGGGGRLHDVCKKWQQKERERERARKWRTDENMAKWQVVQKMETNELIA